MRLAGLEPLAIGDDSLFVNVGERTNVTGSRAFARLILSGDFAGAVEVARSQVQNGAQMIDVNMDEAMLDSKAAMTRFMNLIAAEPDIARVPVMIDSSKWEVIEAGLKCVQGRPIVNSISLKEGEDAFFHHAKLVRRYGAAVIVMAFDEKGQADTLERKTSIARRSYDLLVDKVGFAPEDVVIDPNVFAIATGIEEHDNYAVDFIAATRWIKDHLPHAKVSAHVALGPRERAHIDDFDMRVNLCVFAHFLDLDSRAEACLHGRDAETDEEGRFQLDMARSGSWHLRVQSEANPTVLSEPIRIAPGVTTPEVLIDLSARGSIEGRLRHENGEPSPGTVVSASCGDGLVLTATVNPRGVYRFETLSPEAYAMLSLVSSRRYVRRFVSSSYCFR